MAYSTGTIEFTALPDTHARVVIDDGQGDGHSEVTFYMSTTTSGGTNGHLSGTAASTNRFVGNASKAITLYKSTSINASFLRLGFYSSGTTHITNAQFKEMATGGTTPLIYEFRDADGNIVNITLVNESSGFTNDVSGGTYSRKDSAGNYSINTNNAGVDGDNIAEEIKDILNAADSAGEIVIASVARNNDAGKKAWITISSDATGSENVPIMFRLKRASGSWTSTAVNAVISSWGYSSADGNVMARLFAPDEPIYSFRAAEDGTSGEMDTTTWAAYMTEVINNLPIQITATSSGDTISLTNDNHGTDGNQTITTTDSTNVTISGMSGGASSGGSTVAKRLKISARQIALSGSGGLSGSADTKSALVLDLAGLSAASIAQADVLAFADADGSSLPKKTTFSDFEDAVFANISGDATIAAGGALTIAATSVEGSMLNDNCISGQSNLGGTGVDQADEFLLSDSGVLKAITASNLEDWIFGNISGDATIAAGGALTIAANAVQTGMVHDDVATELGGTGLTATSGVLAVDASQTQITSIGTITTGEWAATDIAVEHGGTGVSTLTDGGILLGSGTGAITAMAVLSDGEMIVGDGTTDPVAESGATLRTSIGVGTGDSPQFTDLTLTGDLTVQGSTVTVDATTINISSSFTFEGPADAYETTFHAGTPTTDLTVYLPQFSASAGTQSFYLPALIDAPTDASSKVTAAEFALLDGDTARGTIAVADGDGILTNDGGTMRQTSVQTFQTYFDANSVGGGNMVTVGALDAGSITSGFGGIDIGTSALSAGAGTLSSLSVGDGDITNVGDINCDSVSVDAAGTGLNIDFSGGNTATNAITLADNLANALEVVEGTTSYLKFITTNGSEQVVFGQNSTFASTTIADLGTVSAATSITATDLIGTNVDGIIGADTARAGTFTTLDCTDGAFAVANLDIDGSTDIGADLADADLLVVDDGAGGTNRKCAISRLKKYIGSATVEDRFTGTAVAANAEFAAGYYSSETPASTGSVSVYFNGLMQSQGTDYTITTTGVITLANDNSLSTEDEVVLKYIKQ